MARRHYRLEDLAKLLEQHGQFPNSRERREQRRQAERRERRGDRGEGEVRPTEGSVSNTDTPPTNLEQGASPK